MTNSPYARWLVDEVREELRDLLRGETVLIADDDAGDILGSAIDFPDDETRERMTALQRAVTLECGADGSSRWIISTVEADENGAPHEFDLGYVHTREMAAAICDIEARRPIEYQDTGHYCWRALGPAHDHAKA